MSKSNAQGRASQNLKSPLFDPEAEGEIDHDTRRRISHPVAAWAIANGIDRAGDPHERKPSKQSKLLVLHTPVIAMCTGDHGAATAMCQMLYWFGNSQETEQPRTNWVHRGLYWIAKSREELAHEIFCPQARAQGYIRRLKRWHMIETEVHKFGSRLMQWIRPIHPRELITKLAKGTLKLEPKWDKILADRLELWERLKADGVIVNLKPKLGRKVRFVPGTAMMDCNIAWKVRQNKQKELQKGQNDDNPRE